MKKLPSLRLADRIPTIDAQNLATFHFYMTCAWVILIVPSVLWWSQSVKWIVIMSVWANVAGHFSAWQASRGEVKQDENNGNGG